MAHQLSHGKWQVYTVVKYDEPLACFFLCFILWTSKVTLKLTSTCVWCFPLKPPTSFPSLHNHKVNSHFICRKYLWTAEASVYTIPVTLLYRTVFLFMWIKWLHFQDFIRLFWFQIFCFLVMPWQIICVGVPLWKVNSVSGVQTAQKHRPLVVRGLPREGWELLVHWNQKVKYLAWSWWLLAQRFLQFLHTHGQGRPGRELSS